MVLSMAFFPFLLPNAPPVPRHAAHRAHVRVRFDTIWLWSQAAWFMDAPGAGARAGSRGRVFFFLGAPPTKKWKLVFSSRRHPGKSQSGDCAVFLATRDAYSSLLTSFLDKYAPPGIRFRLPREMCGAAGMLVDQGNGTLVMDLEEFGAEEDFSLLDANKCLAFTMHTAGMVPQNHPHIWRRDMPSPDRFSRSVPEVATVREGPELVVVRKTVLQLRATIDAIRRRRSEETSPTLPSGASPAATSPAGTIVGAAGS